MIRNQEEETLKLGEYPIARKLCYFLGDWKSITINEWVLEIIRNGYDLLFLRNSVLRQSAVQTPLLAMMEKRKSILGIFGPF